MISPKTSSKKNPTKWPELINRIERTMKWKLNPSENDSLVALSRHFLSRQGYNRNVLKQDLSGHDQAIKDLVGMIERSSPWIREYLNSSDGISDGLWDDLAKTIPGWKEIRCRIKKELKALGPEREGPRQEWAFNAYVSDLCHFYFEVTGERPGGREPKTGNARSFVETCLDFLKQNFGIQVYSIENAMKRDRNLLGFLYPANARVKRHR